MVRLNRIYTRTGDDGTSGLTGGERRRKDDLRFEAMGAVDEANAAIGAARLHVSGDAAIDRCLARIQNDLFDLGADLSCPETGEAPAMEALRIVPSQVQQLESDIDAFNERLQPLRSFVLPGGSAAAAMLHVARTVCRRAERVLVALAAQPGEAVSPPALSYVNRLSDLMFVLARIANDEGRADVLWVPGKHR